jgi:ribosome-binding protein aMBF1 (putative translation factor)
MKPQFIRTEAGEELVVLSRESYDALLAAGGDEAAEDRAMARLVDASTSEASTDIPLWFVELVALHGSPVTAAREHHGCTPCDLAQVLDIPRSQLADIEDGRRHLTDIQRSQIAAHTGVEAGWLI